MATLSGHEMALRIAGLLQDAFALEGEENVEVRPTADQIISVRRGRDRYELRVVKKRGG
jgi:hypothetical protein